MQAREGAAIKKMSGANASPTRSASAIGRSLKIGRSHQKDERSECKPDAKRKRDSAQPQDAKRKRDSAQPQDRAQPSKNKIECRPCPKTNIVPRLRAFATLSMRR